MRSWRQAVMIILAIGLAACGGGSVASGGLSLAEPALAAQPTESALELQAAVAQDEPRASECLLCHLDQARLMDTAKPEEEHISENEGAG